VTQVNSSNPIDTINQAPMSVAQITIVTICVFLNALDGFDVLAISFAAPGIAEDWGINRAALGIVLSMELVGMAFGSLLLGNSADKYGRRPVTLVCLAIMTLGMLAASFTNSIEELSVVRFLTGIGIGGLLASINATAAEYSNAKRRHMAIAILGAGYPLGGILGGMVASYLLKEYDWRAIFVFGAAVTALFIPMVYLLVPETVAYMVRKKPENAVDKVNRALAKIGQDLIDSLPDIQEAVKKTGVKELFSGSLAIVTILLTLAYFMHIMTFYFILKWIPKIVADLGYAKSAAGGVLVWVSVGGFFGSLLYSFLTQVMNTRKLLVGTLLVAAVMVTIFGRAPEDIKLLTIYAATAGFFTNAAVVGLYTMFAHYFPTRVRAGGTGFVIGAGRGGAALSPILAGFLFAADFSLASVAMLMAGGSFIAAIALWFLPERSQAS
jgi:benzoate transport